MLNRIQIRGVRWQIQEIAARLLNQFCGVPAFVKRGIVANNDTAVGQCWQELCFSPGFKDRAVTVALVGERGHQLVLIPSRDKTHSLGPLTPALSRKPFAFGTPTIRIVFGVIDARLIEIHPLIGLVLS